MKFVEVKEIPTTRRNFQCKFEERLGRFMDRNIKYAKVVYDMDEYTSSTGCALAFKRACLWYGFPIDVKQINGEVYLIRRDI